MQDQKTPRHLPRLDVTAYLGEWIALDPKTYAVVVHHRSLQTVRDRAREQGLHRPLFYRVPEATAYFAGSPRQGRDQSNPRKNSESR